MYVTKVFDPVTGEATPNSSGDYYANVELTANFIGPSVAMDVHNTITGSVKDFGADDENGDFVLFPGTEDWVLELDGTNDAHDDNTADAVGDFSGVTMGMNGDSEGEAGTWSGTFHGAPYDVDNSPMPISASGIYHGHFNNGHVLGAFGANMVEE